MFLAGWFLVGAFLGWILSSFRLPSFSFKSPALGFALAVVALLAVAALASLTDNWALWTWLLKTKALFVGLRFQALAIGVLLGLLAERQRLAIDQASRSLGKAIIGQGGNTAWALQGAVALIVIALIVVAVRPDFLSYLRSFKLGTFEATFADKQPTTLREAHLNLRDYREQVALEQYRDFRETFLSKKVARGWARALTMDPALEKETGEITADLISFVEPIIDSLLCLRDANALRVAVRDYDLVAYAAIWENFLLGLHDGKPLDLDQKTVDDFLKNLKTRYELVVAKTNALTPGCVEEGVRKDSKENGSSTAPTALGADVAAHYSTAKRIMAEKGHVKAEVLALTVLEPYLTGAVADLIAFVSGDREKTDFLTKMVDKFPLSDDLISPGMVNLFYQATDSWLNSTGPLPLEKVRARIEYATRGADLLMNRSATKIAELKTAVLGKKASSNPATQTVPSIAADQGVPDPDPLDDPLKLTQIFDIFLRNSFATLTDEVDVYVQHVLAGEAIPPGHHQTWVRTVSRLSEMLRVRLSAPTIELDGVPHTELDEFSKERLRVAKVKDSKGQLMNLIDADFMLQADLAVALSAILLNGNNEPSAQACNSAQFYTRDAAIWVGPIKVGNGLDSAQEQRLEQLIAAVTAHVSEACLSNAPSR